MPTSRRLLTALALLLVAALVPGAPARATPHVPEPRSTSLQLTGNGFGHGHGLSQYGAQGAAKQGRSDRQILRFYYPGLHVGASGGDVRVLISADSSSDVVVLARPGLKVTSIGNGKTYPLSRRGASQWRITPAAGGRTSAVAYKSGGWTTVRTVPGEAEFTAGGRPITLHTPAGDVAYRGVLRSAAPHAGRRARDTVNVLPLDSYLKGVVPREVPALWKPAALRAQAVAARTYAAFERAQPLAGHFQICDTSLCQVYGGYSAEAPRTSAAVDATARQVLLWHGTPAFTQFSASNGGWSAAGSQPYLVAKKDPYDRAYRGWNDTVTASEVERALPAIGSLRGVRVLERDGHGRWGGRVMRIEITGSNTSTTISGDAFRSYFGLRSTYFTVS